MNKVLDFFLKICLNDSSINTKYQFIKLKETILNVPLIKWKGFPKIDTPN
jgi:hypothetical protein